MLLNGILYKFTKIYQKHLKYIAHTSYIFTDLYYLIIKEKGIIIMMYSVEVPFVNVKQLCMM